MVATHRHEIATRGQGETHDITDIVAAAIAQSACAGGLATVFVVGSTAGVTTIEYEPGAVADLNRLFEKSRRATPTIAITCAGATTTDRATSAPRCSDRR